MPAFDGTLLTFLTGACLVLLVVLLLLILRISSRISKLEARTHGELLLPEPMMDAPSDAEVPAGGVFERFLNENPSCRDLPKGEQAKAYRKWRQEMGMNWSKS